MDLALNECKRKFVFIPNWKSLIFFVCFFPILIALGLWQLDRAKQKQEIINAAMDLYESDPKPIASVDNINYQPIYFRGRFDSTRYWLLDNKVRYGRAGFEVISVVSSKNVNYLINLGWIEGDPARRSLPEVDLPVGEVEVFATIYKPSKNVLLDSKNGIDSQWPKIITEINFDQLSQQLGQPLSEIYLLINAQSPHAFVTDWQWVNQMPDRHKGYALQWFAMAAFLFILSVFSNTNLMAVIKGDVCVRRDYP